MAIIDISQTGTYEVNPPNVPNALQNAAKFVGENMCRAGSQIKAGVTSLREKSSAAFNNIDQLLQSEAAKRTNPDRPALTILTKPTTDEIAMGNSVFEFTFDVQPQNEISVTGAQNIAIFKSPGLRPQYQNLGPADSTINWKGLMLGPSAWDDVINLKKVQEAGVSIIIMFGPMMKIGIIRNFSYNINRFNLIQYSMSVLIEEDKDSQTYYTKFNPLLDKSLLKDFPWLERYQNITGYINNVSSGIGSFARDAAKKIGALDNLIDGQVYNYGSLANTPVSELYSLQREISSVRTSVLGGRTGLYSCYMNTQYSGIIGRSGTVVPGRQR